MDNNHVTLILNVRLIHQTYFSLQMINSATMSTTLMELFEKNSVDYLIKEDNRMLDKSISDNNLRCYHGVLSRNEADTILKKESASNDSAVGKFLIRTSVKSTDHLILSICGIDRVLHFPILRNVDGTCVIDKESFLSIDELLNYSIQHSLKLFGVKLTLPMIKNVLPDELRKSGVNTLLHRIVESGTEEMLMKVISHHECPSLSVKNEKGYTPLHIACYLNRDTMIEIFMCHGAKYEIVNEHGWNSIHMAALGNNPSSLYLMRVNWKADLERVNPLNMFTALHCAILCNNVESAKMLIALGANRMALNDLNKTPLDLARDIMSDEIIIALSITNNSTLINSKANWFIGDLPLDQQLQWENALRPKDGQFFVRDSSSKDNAYTVCIGWDERWIHIHIDKTPTGYVLFGDQKENKTLEETVTYMHRLYPSLLHPLAVDEIKSKIASGVIKLNETVNNQQLQISPKSVFKRSKSKNFNDKYLKMPGISSGLFQRRSSTPNFINNTHANSITELLPKINRPKQTLDLKSLLNGSIYSLRSKARNIPTLSSSSVQMGNLIAEGNFGQVFEGYYVDKKFLTHAVAIKVLKDAFNEANRKEFLQEAKIMKNLTHPFIVRLFGVATSGNKFWMIQELLPMGSLHTYLQNNRNENLNELILLWTVQLTEGMRYMATKRYVHRDLAARNLLLASISQIKISDFGLARYTGNNDNNLYIQRSNAAVPLAWYAPEAITHFTFTSKSDVWSFGITVWEMYSNGRCPYKEIGHPQLLIHYLLQNYRLSKPTACSDGTWSLLQLCWNINPYYRLSFDHIAANMYAMPEYQSAYQATVKMSGIVQQHSGLSPIKSKHQLLQSIRYSNIQSIQVDKLHRNINPVYDMLVDKLHWNINPVYDMLVNKLHWDINPVYDMLVNKLHRNINPVYDMQVDKLHWNINPVYDTLVYKLCRNINPVYDMLVDKLCWNINPVYDMLVDKSH
ncbi:hypothetical protein GJ496_008033 [Pomphorhynchus laevis]|nr:hypothetical protein GJ496_008033 [Pomphorhynchus laevis]